jgi:hypothetical protein
MQTLNSKITIGFENFMRNNRLYENKDGDINIKPDKRIEIQTKEDIIFAIHFLLTELEKDLLIDKIVDFDEIYKNAKKD